MRRESQLTESAAPNGAAKGSKGSAEVLMVFMMGGSANGWLLSGTWLLMGGCGVSSDGVMVVGVESCGWRVVTGDELTTSRGDDVYLTFLECHGKGGASVAKSQRGAELREGTECGFVRNHGRPLRCARDASIAA